jgi:hypothetical protein
MTTTTSSSNQRYLREFSAAMVAYTLVLVVSLTALKGVGDSSIWRYPLAVLPVLPGVAALIAFVRRLRDMDELERRIQFEALGIAFAVTILVTFTYGFLENAGLPRLSAIWVTPFMIAAWGVSSLLVNRRYA